MSLATAPQVATVSDSTHWKIKRANSICKLFRQYYNETITTDEMAAKIGKDLNYNPGTVKTLLSEYRRNGWRAPKCARKHREATATEVQLSFEELNALWGK